MSVEEIKELEKNVGDICIGDYDQKAYTFSVGAITEINKAFDRFKSELEAAKAEITELTAEVEGFRLPLNINEPVYIICRCSDISMYYDNDYEHGTGNIECPFEDQCKYEDCEKEHIQIMETAVTCIYNDFETDDGLKFGVSGVNYGKPHYFISDIGKTVFLTREEAEKAIAEKGGQDE